MCILAGISFLRSLERSPAVLWSPGTEFRPTFKPRQWRSDRGAGGAGRTGRHLLGAAKGRKTPTKSTDFFARQTTDFCWPILLADKIGQLRRLADILFRFVQLEAAAALYGRTGSTYLFVLCFRQALQFQKPKTKGQQI